MENERERERGRKRERERGRKRERERENVTYIGYDSMLYFGGSCTDRLTCFVRNVDQETCKENDDDSMVKRLRNEGEKGGMREKKEE